VRLPGFDALVAHRRVLERLGSRRSSVPPALARPLLWLRHVMSHCIHTMLIALVACLALATGAGAEGLDQSFPASEGGRLRIALDFGQVDVVTVEAEEVRIEAQARGVGASGVHFDARAEGRDVVLTGRAEPWVAWLRSTPRVRVRAFVPSAWAVDLAELGAPGSSWLVHQP
jgi:hypothetical protein